MEGMIMEEREEVMLVRRPARFLTPTFSSSTASFDLPPSAFHSNHHNLPGRNPIHVSFPGWKNPMPRWSEWVDHMTTLHHSTWHRAGIYEPIMASKCHIEQDVNLVMVLGERWNKTTNTFVFPWGEATVTLEDVMILGGYSVLGQSVISPVESHDNEEFLEIDQSFNTVRKELNKTRSRKVSQSMWMSAFMGNGGHVAHVAFLVLWLSRHVFPFTHDTVVKHLHEIGFALSKGKRLALAPAVLACVYRDLKSLKDKIISMSEEGVNQERLKLWAQMQYVQIWAWERFPALLPRPNFRHDGEPRMGCWKNIGIVSNADNVRTIINNAGKEFVWRPYSMSEKFDFYPEKEQWVSFSPDTREDYKSFAKIVSMPSLIGPSCVESYFPCRISMQFGIDQDIPGKVASSERTTETAWEMFDRSSEAKKLHIPSRVFVAGTTTRYQTWWNSLRLGNDHTEFSENHFLGIPSSSRMKKKTISEGIATSSNFIGPQIPIYPPGFEPSDIEEYDDAMAEQSVKEKPICKRGESSVEKSQMKNVIQDYPKRKKDEEDHDPLDNLTTKELLSLAIKRRG